MTRSEYGLNLYQQMLLFWTIMAFAMAIIVLASNMLPKFEVLNLNLHIVGNSADFAFFIDTQRPSRSLSCLRYMVK